MRSFAATDVTKWWSIAGCTRIVTIRAHRNASVPGGGGRS